MVGGITQSLSNLTCALESVNLTLFSMGSGSVPRL